MFGYHDSNRCSFDLWSPSRETAVENRTFSAWAFHNQQLEDIVDAIAHGNTSISVSDDFTDDDLTYVRHRLNEKYGLDADMELN
jgi:hypothetical protein